MVNLSYFVSVCFSKHTLCYGSDDAGKVQYIFAFAPLTRRIQNYVDKNEQLREYIGKVVSGYRAASSTSYFIAWTKNSSGSA